MFDFPKKVKLVEVGPRDGLQNEKKVIPVFQKIALIEKLSESGLQFIESGSFVSPEWVPQMADSEKVLKGVKRKNNVSYSALVPNIQGLKSALSAKVSEISIFVAASETFSKKKY